MRKKKVAIYRDLGFNQSLTLELRIEWNERLVERVVQVMPNKKKHIFLNSKFQHVTNRHKLYENHK